jgi:hypothetical protein
MEEFILCTPLLENGMDTLHKLSADWVKCTKDIRRRNITIACGPRSHTECQNKWYVCCHRHPLNMQSQAPSQNTQSLNFLTMFGANSTLDEMKNDCNIGIDMRLQVEEPCCIYFLRDLLPKKVSSSC